MENICKSCYEAPVASRSLCSVCLADYRYEAYRKHIELRQLKANRPISKEGSRWSKAEMRVLKLKIKEALITGAHTQIRVAKVRELFEIKRSFANKILQELMAEGLIIKRGKSTNTFYEVVK